jgi:hypothetical protein
VIHHANNTTPRDTIDRSGGSLIYQCTQPAPEPPQRIACRASMTAARHIHDGSVIQVDPYAHEQMKTLTYLFVIGQRHSLGVWSLPMPDLFEDGLTRIRLRSGLLFLSLHVHMVWELQRESIGEGHKCRTEAGKEARSWTWASSRAL